MTTFEPHRGPPLSAPLDYVPTAPVHKPRRALRRSLRAAIYAATALTIAFFAPVAVAALAGLGALLIGLQWLAEKVGADE